jgi:hypothetical protein
MRIKCFDAEKIMLIQIAGEPTSQLQWKMAAIKGPTQQSWLEVPCDKSKQILDAEEQFVSANKLNIQPKGVSC